MLIAEKENEMRSIINRLKGYLEKKWLELNAEKSKMMRFSKEGGRLSKRNWRWKGKKIEEVKEFAYLEYTEKRRARNSG